MSTAGTLSVPYASAAIAWAPPTLNTRVTPAMRAAVNIAAGTLPSFPGGVTMIISGQPAMRAGITSINTVEGYAAVPPGTYTPTLARGSTLCPVTTPCALWVSKPSRRWSE